MKVFLGLLEERYADGDNGKYPTGNTVKDDLWRALVANTTHMGKEATDDYSKNFDAYINADVPVSDTLKDPDLVTGNIEDMINWK